MPPKTRTRRNAKAQNNEEENIFLNKLTSSNCIINDSLVTFGDILPPYGERIKCANQIMEIYDDIYDDQFSQKLRQISLHRDNLKELIKNADKDIKIPITPKRGKNVSKIAQAFEKIEQRKEMREKNLFASGDASFTANEEIKPGLVLALRSRFNNANCTKNVAGPSNATVESTLLLSQKRTRNTAERAALLAEQDNNLRRADHKKQDLLKQKAEKTKKEREEKARLVEERKRQKEMEREEKLRIAREREEKIKEFQQKTTPTRNNCFKTPKSTVLRPKHALREDIVNETLEHDLEKTQHRGADGNKTPVLIPDQSMCNSTIYQTPIARKRKSDMSQAISYGCSTLKTQCVLFDDENVTPEALNVSDSRNTTKDMFQKFEEEFKSAEPVEDMFLSPAQPPRLLEDTVISTVEYAVTPDKKPLPSTDECYNIADLSEGDGTDDEDKPRKKIPSWARTDKLKTSLLQQTSDFRTYESIQKILGKPKPFVVERIFKNSKYTRASSAMWTSPLSNPRRANAVYYQLSDSIAETSHLD
uniref:INCENP_ARK-bind domain-containing protein n=1 Tax=Parastrongyloides trichosuri TaxID=131310 RepID=A0A0N5A1M2_PARTI